MANRVRVKVKAIGALTSQDAAAINKAGKEEIARGEEKMETESSSETDLSKVRTSCNAPSRCSIMVGYVTLTWM